jgi:hypothetical protein
MVSKLTVKQSVTPNVFAKSTLVRDDYGALFTSPQSSTEDCAAYRSAEALVKKAALSKKIPRAYDIVDWDRKGRASGSALHHEIYDFNPSAVLVCCRATEGNKYGVRTTDKTYFLVSRQGRGVRVAEAKKSLAAKAAKAAGTALGAAIAVVRGKAIYTAPANRVRTGYKLVERSDTGGLISVWDKSDWTLGKTRTEAATEDHNGGFYYYATLEEAINAASANETFGKARQHNRLVVIEVEASGKHFEHGGKHGIKLCASRIKPVREVAATL